MSTTSLPLPSPIRTPPSPRETGPQLAKLLQENKAASDAVVIGIEPGGMLVATEIADRLSLSVDVLAIEAVMPPFYSSWQLRPAIGAVASTGGVVLEEHAIERLRLSRNEVEAAVEAAEGSLYRRRPGIRRGWAPDLRGKTVILVDETAETGFTLRAAIAALRKLEPRRIVAAVPAAPETVYREVVKLPDQFVCPVRVPDFASLSSYNDSL